MALLRCSWLGWGIREASRRPTAESIRSPAAAVIWTNWVVWQQQRKGAARMCRKNTRQACLCSRESKSPHLHVEHGDCSGESGKGRRWCFSTVIKVNRATNAVCAAVSVWGWAELFYFYLVGINILPLSFRERETVANKITQWFESFCRMVIIYGTVWTYPCLDI